MSTRDRSTSRSPVWLTTLGLTLALTSGCYSGLGDAPPAGGDGAADGAGDAGNDGDGDGQVPREPAAEEPENPFNVPTDEARLLPFPVRMQNLAHVVGQDLSHPMFLELYELRYQLGDHDYASGVASDLRWSAERMQYWVRGLKPVCTSTEMQAAYPDLLTDPRPLMRSAWGHEPAADEVEAVLDLQGGSLPPEDLYMVSCAAVLTSLDFVSI